MRYETQHQLPDAQVAENRLISAAPELLMQDDTKVEFVYDYMGRRVKKTVSVWNGSWTQESEKLFVYDGWNMICEITSENSQPATEKYYVWGLDLTASLFRERAVSAGLRAYSDT
ncbi:MAG: hypothetical protein GY749_18740 [Desulfobacteraceae bacterium]|nr:hypothetical protein [Desulfobacteraceae bacterium]